MGIEKLHLICPQCLQVNDQIVSTVDEERECTECGKISNSSDFTISSVSDSYKADVDFPSAFYKTKGESWSLMIKPRHYDHIVVYVCSSIIPIFLGLYLFMFSVFFGLIPFVLGSYFAWILLARFFGRVEIELDNNTLTLFRGIGFMGRTSYFRWRYISAIKSFQSESSNWALRFFMQNGKEQKEHGKDIFLDLTEKQIIFIENFLYHKLDIRDKKMARIDSGPDTEELKFL